MKILKKILTLITFLGIGVMLQAKDLKVMTYNIYGARLTNGDKLGEVIKNIIRILLYCKKLIKIQYEVIKKM